jgi:branched-chain amino acid transport system ATP-binding protein
MLKLSNVSAYYGNIKALKDISLEVADGELVAIIGANGAGKTTTLKTICGLVKAREGTVNFESKDLSKSSTDEIVKCGISLVPEGRRVFPRMSVLENLEMGAFLRNDRTALKQDYDLVMALFPRLKQRLSQPAGTLSGGEQQMLAIGRALMARPRLMLLDEPSMGLAPLIVEQIFEIIQRINKEGTTVLLVEQNARMALTIADRGYVIETGNIIMSAPAHELLDNEKVKSAYLGE